MKNTKDNEATKLSLVQRKQVLKSLLSLHNSIPLGEKIFTYQELASHHYNHPIDTSTKFHGFYGKVFWVINYYRDWFGIIKNVRPHVIYIKPGKLNEIEKFIYPRTEDLSAKIDLLQISVNELTAMLKKHMSSNSN